LEKTLEQLEETGSRKIEGWAWGLRKSFPAGTSTAILLWSKEAQPSNPLHSIPSCSGETVYLSNETKVP
jgi:hypothetical protein